MTFTVDTVDVFATPHAEVAATPLTVTLKLGAGHSEAGGFRQVTLMRVVAITARTTYQQVQQSTAV